MLTSAPALMRAMLLSKGGASAIPPIKVTQRRKRKFISTKSFYSIKKDICKKAEQEWPDDYGMQKYVIEEQTKAYKELKNYRASDIPSRVLKAITQKALREWPGDYGMQIYAIKEQVEAYRELHR